MNILKELRIEQELLQSDIAKLINKNEREVGFYETGERDMNTETSVFYPAFLMYQSTTYLANLTYAIQRKHKKIL